MGGVLGTGAACSDAGSGDIEKEGRRHNFVLLFLLHNGNDNVDGFRVIIESGDGGSNEDGNRNERIVCMSRYTWYVICVY